MLKRSKRPTAEEELCGSPPVDFLRSLILSLLRPIAVGTLVELGRSCERRMRWGAWGSWLRSSDAANEPRSAATLCPPLMTKHFSAASAAAAVACSPPSPQPSIQQGQLRDTGTNQGSHCLSPQIWFLLPPTCFRSGNHVEQGNEIRIAFNP